MANIELKNITKSWGDFHAVKDTSLTIKDREFLVLLGPSGCGKTTTMRMVAGLETPTSGDILIDGKRVNDLEPKDRNVAMVFQSYALYAHLNVYENICFPMRMRKVPKSEWKERAMRAAKMVELEHLLERLPKELSGGQRQRVALARAIVREKPSCFLMDEPLSNLDAKLRVTMRTEIKYLQQTLQITTIYVTHDQIEAMTLADRIAVVRDGEIQQLASPREMYDRPATLFVAGFIGNPPMNLLKGKIAQGQFSSTGVAVSMPTDRESNNVTLGVRAEDLECCSLEEAQITGEIYTVEQMGDCNMVTMVFDDGNRLLATMDKMSSQQQGEQIGFRAKDHSYFLFDNATEERLEL